MNIEYLTKKIRSSDLTIVDICKKAKIARQTIYNIMHEYVYPDLDTVLDICKVLGLNGTEIAIVIGIKGEE